MVYRMVMQRDFEFTPQGISSDEVLIQRTIKFMDELNPQTDDPVYIAL